MLRETAMPAGFTGRLLRVNGIELNVVDAGRGPPVLLVHGFPDTHAVWRHQIPALVQAGYRVIAPDTRGCGASEMPPRVSDYSIDLLVADLVALLNALGIDRVKLVAHDWGAVIAWHFALRHPQRVERYIALSVGHPDAYARGGWKQKLKGYYILFLQLRGLAEWLVQLGNWWLFRRMIGYPAEFPHWKAQLSKPGRLTAGMNYYRANLSLILPGNHGHALIPIVGVWSECDRFLDEGQMSGTGRYCDAGFHYERLERASHWMQLDAPAQLNALLLKHLQGLPRAR